MPHPARRQVGLAAIRQGGLGAGVLLGVVVFPFDADGAVEADAVQLDEDFLATIGVPGRPRGHKVPAVERVPHGSMPAQEPGAGVLSAHLDALDVGAVDEVAELADELHDADALPFHVAAVEVEADDAFEAGLAHEVDVIGRRLDVAHRSLARMAFEIEGDAFFLA